MNDLRLMSPNDVKLAENIRKDADVDAAFVESIKSQGVLVPLLAYEDMLGQVSVYDGQRRVLAARRAGLEQVPVLVTPDPSSDLARITSQFTLNEARQGMSMEDKAAAVQQMSLFGMSIDDIAAKTGQRFETVEALQSIADSKNNVLGVLNSAPELTLMQVAKLADLEKSEYFDADDMEELLTSLEEEPEQADYFLQKAADSADSRRKNLELRAYLEAEGIKVLDQMPANAARLWEIRDEGGRIPQANEHESCPAHAYVDPHHAVNKRTMIAVCLNPELHKTASMVEEDRLKHEEELKRKAEERERNAAWKSARAVRLEFVYSLLRSLPKNAVEWAIRFAMPSEENPYVSWELSNPSEMLAEAGVLPQRVTAQGWVTSTDKGARAAIVAGAFARVERMMKTPPPAHMLRACSGYLEALEGWGYTLSAPEKDVLKRLKELETPQ